MTKKTAFFLFFLLVSCNSIDTKKETHSFFDTFFDVPYVISIKDSIRKHRSDSLGKKNPQYLPPPKSSEYGNVNIIFHKNDKIFFHTKQGLIGCGTGREMDEIDFLNLQPNDIIEISKTSIFDVILKNSKYSQNFPYISISSSSDTIKNPILGQIIDSLKTNKLNYYFVRMISEEETNVLNAKLYKEYYSEEEYEWKKKYRNKTFRK